MTKDKKGLKKMTNCSNVNFIIILILDGDKWKLSYGRPRLLHHPGRRRGERIVEYCFFLQELAGAKK